MSKYSFWLIVFSATITIFSFQNCSVHESEGRSILEEQGVQFDCAEGDTECEEANEQVNSKSLYSPDACLPYLSSEFIQNELQSDQVRIWAQLDASNRFTCMSSSLDRDANEMDTVVCHIAKEYLLNDYNRSAFFPEGAESLTSYENSLAFYKKQENGIYLVGLLASIAEQSQGVYCKISWSENSEIEVAAALKRLESYTKEILKHF